MSESAYTRKLIEFLGKKFDASKSGCYFKISDRFTKAIPDLVVVAPPRGTSWFELKEVKTKKLPTFVDLRIIVDESPLQFHNMKKISLASGNAWYIFYHENATYFTRPEYLNRECELYDTSLRGISYSLDNIYEEMIDTKEGRIIYTRNEGHKILWDLCTKERIL